MAQMISEKQISSVELVEAHLARIDEVNESLNAVVQIVPERALDEARAADSATAKDPSRGPFHGVPITLKDSLETEGIVSTAGTLGRKSYVPEEDATAAARLRNSGAVLVGKTNTPEIMMAFQTDNLVYGRTNNPYDLSRTPGAAAAEKVPSSLPEGHRLGWGAILREAYGCQHTFAAFQELDPLPAESQGMDTFHLGVVTSNR